jgi:hypothetical protein
MDIPWDRWWVKSAGADVENKIDATMKKNVILIIVKLLPLAGPH